MIGSAVSGAIFPYARDPRPNREVRIWDPATGQTALTGRTGWVRAVAWSPDGARLATAREDREVRIWNPTTDDTISFTDHTGHTGQVNAVAWSPDGTRQAMIDLVTLQMWL